MADISTEDDLRSLYREPHDMVKAKKAPQIKEAMVRFLAASPFFCLSTSDADGRCDVSPRGGPPGQLKVLDDGRSVAFPDLSGNNLIDSLSNIAANPYAGLLAMVPGSDETLRIDGPARITTDPGVLGLWDDELRTPKVAVVVEVEAAFLHCAKAYRRSGLWQPETWQPVADTVAPEMYNQSTGADIDPAEMRTMLEADYDASLAAEKAGDGPAEA